MILNNLKHEIYMRLLFIVFLISLSTNIFAFESERLCFRAAMFEDIDSIMECIQAPEDFKFILPDYFTVEMAKELYQRRVTYPRNEYLFAVEEKDTKEFIGYCGISNRYNNAAKFYFAVSPQKRKLGYGFEIEKRMIDYVKNELTEFESFLHTCVPENTYSIKIAQKLGLEYLGKHGSEEDPEEVYLLKFRP